MGVVAAHGLDEQLCTGVALLPNLVLTARHCTALERSSLLGTDCSDAAVIAPTPAGAKIRVLPGSDVDLVMEDQERTVKEIWLNDDLGRLCGEDLALLYLAAEPADLSSNTSTTIAVATPVVPDSGAVFVTLGYGLNNGDWGRQRQNDAAVLTCRGTACSDSRLVDAEFLAASGACEGDSGGPAFDSEGRVFAIASRSSASCAETVYLTFENHWGWLTGSVRQAAALGAYPIPEWAAIASTGTGPDLAAVPPNPGTRIAGGCTITTAHGGGANGWGAMVVGAALGARHLTRSRKRATLGRGR